VDVAKKEEYVPEQEFLKNPEKEIQRFKDFLVLLEQGRN
jgi:hypothetical protein